MLFLAFILRGFEFGRCFCCIISVLVPLDLNDLLEEFSLYEALDSFFLTTHL